MIRTIKDLKKFNIPGIGHARFGAVKGTMHLMQQSEKHFIWCFDTKHKYPYVTSYTSSEIEGEIVEFWPSDFPKNIKGTEPTTFVLDLPEGYWRVVFNQDKYDTHIIAFRY